MLALAAACILLYRPSSTWLPGLNLLLTSARGPTPAACTQSAHCSGSRAAHTGTAPAPAPAAAQPARNRTLTVVNACNFTVWPLTYGAPMLGNGSFMLRSGENATFIAPPAWLGTWGARTGCRADNGSAGACETGQCGPNFRCYNGNVAPYTQARTAPPLAACAPRARRTHGRGGAPRSRCCSTPLAARTFTT